MDKIAVVYWSGTGNTEEMAKHVAEGVKSADAEVALLLATEFTADMVGTYNAIAFGCPSMGVEVLEESEFQPMWDNVLPKLKDKKIALFGSYGWGDGEWMRDWNDACAKAGAILACEFVICQAAPDADAQSACKMLGTALVK